MREDKKMKKVLAIVFIALIVLTVSGCKKTETTTKPAVTGESTELDQDLKNLDSVDQEINTSDLDNLDEDLEKVNW